MLYQSVLLNIAYVGGKNEMVKFSQSWDSLFSFLACVMLSIVLINLWDSNIFLTLISDKRTFYPFRIGETIGSLTILHCFTPSGCRIKFVEKMVNSLRTIFDRHSRRIFKCSILESNTLRQMPVYRTVAIPPRNW